MEYVKMADAPVPIYFAKLAGEQSDDAPDVLDEPILHLLTQPGGLTFRGVAGSRLPTILRTGIDVTPTDSVIYCDLPDKAFEYGGPDKVMLALRYRGSNGEQVLRRAVSHILPDTPPEVAAKVRRTYPHEVGRTEDGVITRCRVLPDGRARLQYLSTYGYFIDGDPWDALAGILIYSTTRQGHTAAAQAVIDSAAGPAVSSS